MSIFVGSGVALVTPFQKDGSVDYEKLEELLEFHCENGTDAIIICGTTGEASALSAEEHLAVVGFTAERVRGRVPVIAGAGSNCTQTAIETSKRAEEAGADGLLLVTPYYNKCTQEGLFLHYQMIAEEVKLPILLYNVPGRTGVNIAPETAAKLYREVGNIAGIKEASGNITQAAQIMNLTDGKIDLYAGNDDQIVPIFSLGGKGVISVLANLAPKYTHRMCSSYFSGETAESARLQWRAMPLVEALFCEVNPIPVKRALNLMGRNVGSLRMPLTEMTEAHSKILEERLRDFRAGGYL